MKKLMWIGMLLLATFVIAASMRAGAHHENCSECKAALKGDVRM